MARRLLLKGARAALLPLLLMTTSAHAQEALRGIALAIGQSDYDTLADLANTERDAESIEDILDRLGFDTSGQNDRNARQLNRDLEGFLDDAEDADVAVLYYAGHAVEIGGENYLLPVDADASSPEALAEKLIPLSATVTALQKKVPVSIVLLDACRDNPLPPGTTVKLTTDGEPLPVTMIGAGTRGVTVLSSRTPDAPGDNFGIVVGFATQPGNVALDGEPGGNSPYAAALVRHLSAMAGAEFGTVMRMVAEEVYLKTAGRQRPWVNESLRRLLYFGEPMPEQEGAEGAILKERRQLLLTIAGLPEAERASIETVARDGGVPLDAVYAMLKALGAEAPSDPAELEALLRKQTEQIRKMQAERAAIQSTDPEIARLAALADQAIAEGALETAGALNGEAKARVAEIEQTVTDAEADIKARRLEFAEVYARSGKTAYMRFDYEQSAADYEQAFRQAERWNDWDAWSYRGNQAVALQALGWRGGQTPRLYEALEMAHEIVRLSERLPGREEWALSQVFLGNTLLTLGQRENNKDYLRQAAAAFEAALGEVQAGESAYQIDRPEIAYNLAGARQQLAYLEKDHAALEAVIAEFAALADAAGRDVDPKRWARAKSSEASSLVDLSRDRKDAAGMRRAAAMLEDAIALRTGSDEPEEVRDFQRLLAVALSEAGDMTDDRDLLLDAAARFDAAIPRINEAAAPATLATTLQNRAINAHKLFARDNDPAWLEKALDDYLAATRLRDPEAMKRDWADSTAGIGGVRTDLGRYRKDVGMIRQGRQDYLTAHAALDPAVDTDEWLRTGWLAADALRSEGEIARQAAPLTMALDEFSTLIDESTRRGIADRDRLFARIAMVAHGYATLAKDIGGETAIAGIDRAERLVADLSPGALAGVHSARGRALHALADNDAVTMQRSADAYRAALVPEARQEPFDGWSNTQANLAVSLKALSGLRNDPALLAQAIAAWREVQAGEKDESAWRTNQRNLAGALDSVGTAQSYADAAGAWGALLDRVGASAPASERADLLEKRGLSLHNEAALEADIVSGTGSRRAAISDYRATLALASDDEAMGVRVRENLADLLKTEGDLSGDPAQVKEAAELYTAALSRPARAGDAAKFRRIRLKQASSFAAHAFATGDRDTLDRSVRAFAARFGPVPGADDIAADWIAAATYGNALRILGQPTRDVATLRHAADVLAAVASVQGGSLDPANRAWLDASRGETLVSIADAADDTAAARQAVDLWRAATAHYTPEAYPDAWRGPNGGLASALLTLGRLSDDPAALEEAASVYARLIAATDRAAEGLAWADYANGGAYVGARLARLGKGDAASISQAATLARAARDIFAAEAPVSLPHVEDTLCSVLIEKGRLTADRATVQEALAVCDASRAGFGTADPTMLAEVDRTIARGKAVLSAMD